MLICLQPECFSNNVFEQLHVIEIGNYIAASYKIGSNCDWLKRAATSHTALRHPLEWQRYVTSADDTRTRPFNRIETDNDVLYVPPTCLPPRQTQ
jgi:hypothetical protein